MQNLLKKFSFTKGRAIRTLAGLFIALIFVGQAGHWLEIPFVERLDGIIYDVRLRLTAPGGVDPRIVIVDIDEQSLREREAGGEGRWPWPRDRLALLTNRLFDDYNVNLMGFDVIFSERDESSGIKTIEKLAREDFKSDAAFQERFAKIKPSLDLDSQFAKSLKERATVLGFSFLIPGDQQKKGALPPAAITVEELPLGLVDPTS